MAQPSTTEKYPWYDLVSGSELQQGDILLKCPLLDMPLAAIDATGDPSIKIQTQNAIILTQSCDLAIRDDRTCQAEQVVLCPIYLRDELKEDKTFGNPSGWEKARKGQAFAYHVLNKSDLPQYSFDYRLVDLGALFSLPVRLVRELAQEQGLRVRLNPPYREHLSQAFARFFMRVGLPVDIPQFTS